MENGAFAVLDRVLPLAQQFVDVGLLDPVSAQFDLDIGDVAVEAAGAKARPDVVDRHPRDALGDLDRVRQLIDGLETKRDIAQVLELAREGSATRIFIGSENKLFSLTGSSVIAAPYHGSDGRVVGVVGVIGPTRLNYARIVPMVDFTARQLSRLIQ